MAQDSSSDREQAPLLPSDLYRRGFEHDAAARLLLDENGRILTANHAAATLLGQEADALAGQTLADLAAPDSPEQSRVLHNPRQGGSPVLMQITTTLYGASGSFRAGITLVPLPDAADGQPGATLAAIDDVTTDQRRIEALQDLVHDLKNPLTNVQSAVDMLAETAQDEDSLALLRATRQSADQMAALINRLLGIARDENGPAMQRTRLPLNPLLRDVVESFQPAAQAQGVALTFSPLDPEAVTVQGDDTLLRQAFQNLITNAIKYTPTGGAVHISGIVTADEAIIQVQDTGLGIPANEIPHLFQRFRRVQSHSHQRIDGTGLGLAIIKAIVEQHEGRIWVDSEPGAGSTFTLALPFD